MYKDKVTGKYLTEEGGVGEKTQTTVVSFSNMSTDYKRDKGERAVEKKHGYNFSSDNFLFKQQQQATRSQQFNLIPLSPQRLLTRLRCLLVACEPVMFQQFCPTDDAQRKFPQHQIHHLCPPPTQSPDNHRQTRGTQRWGEGGKFSQHKAAT